jgi:type I restriction enzyme S subunit
MNQAWATRPLGEIFEIGAGKTMSKAAREGPDKVPFLRTANVLWDEIDLTELDEMAIDPAELQQKSLAPGDLLVCEGGEIGRAAVWTGAVTPISFQNHLHRLRPSAPGIEPRFYVYFLQSAFTQLGLFAGAGNKTTIPNLSRNQLAALDVPQPSPQEQKDIARVLRAVRMGMTAHQRSAAHALDLKRTAMRELFTRGLRGEPQKETEIGPIPSSWDQVSFAKVREWLQYGTSTRCTIEPAGHPVLRIPNVESGRVNPADLKYCDLPEEEAAKYMLENGDLLFIRTNGVLDRLGSCAVFRGEPAGALFASYLIRARPKSNVEPRFAAYFYGSERGTSLVAGSATPAADGKYNLNTGTIDSLPLPLPKTREEQQEIVAVLDAIDRKIDLHQRKNAVLEELFKSLLHKLMTGEVHVADLDLSALPAPEEAR